MIPDFNNPDNICSEDPRKIYPFKGINYTAEEINRLLAAIDKKASIDMIRDGLSAYEVAVANGYKGSVDQWLMSLRGPRGEAFQFEDLTAAEIEVLREPANKAAEEVKSSTDKLLQDTEVKVNEVLAKGDAAGEAATKANEAASSATTAAGKANEATDKANEATGKASTAADNATAATGNANAAADKANAAADKATNEGLFKTPQDLSEEEQGQVKQNLGIEDLMASLETQTIDGFSETVSSTTSLKTEDNIIPKSLDFAIVDLGSTDGRDVPDSPSMSVVLAKVPGSGRVKMQGYLKTTHEEYNIQVVEGAAEKDALNVNIITDTETTYKVFQIRYLSSIDSSKFKGSYGQLSELKAAYPTASDGSYAFVGNPRHLYEWATNAWTDRGEFTTSVDQAIDPQSERAIANKAVSAKLTELDNKSSYQSVSMVMNTGGSGAAYIGETLKKDWGDDVLLTINQWNISNKDIRFSYHVDGNEEQKIKILSIDGPGNYIVNFEGKPTDIRPYVLASEIEMEGEVNITLYDRLGTMQYINSLDIVNNTNEINTLKEDVSLTNTIINGGEIIVSSITGKDLINDSAYWGLNFDIGYKLSDTPQSIENYSGYVAEVKSGQIIKLKSINNTNIIPWAITDNERLIVAKNDSFGTGSLESYTINVEKDGYIYTNQNTATKSSFSLIIEEESTDGLNKKVSDNSKSIDELNKIINTGSEEEIVKNVTSAELTNDSSYYALNIEIGSKAPEVPLEISNYSGYVTDVKAGQVIELSSTNNTNITPWALTDNNKIVRQISDVKGTGSLENYSLVVGNDGYIYTNQNTATKETFSLVIKQSSQKGLIEEVAGLKAGNILLTNRVSKNEQDIADLKKSQGGSSTVRIGYMNMQNEEITDGKRVELEYNNIRKNYSICGYINFTKFEKVRFGKDTSEQGFIIEVDNTNVKLTRSRNGTDDTLYPHGLTISTFLGFDIRNIGGYSQLFLYSDSGRYKLEKEIMNPGYDSAFFESVGTTGTLLSFSQVNIDYNKDIWLIQDSYGGWVNWGWAYNLYKIGYDTFLLDSHGGAGSLSQLTVLKTHLKYATPKYLVWAMGMNDKDTGDIYNANWKLALDEVIQICNEKGIELILCTIPNAVKEGYINTYKNRYVRTLSEEQSYKLIDFADAVQLSFESSEWKPGLLSDDELHPNEKGGQVLSIRAATDFPQLLNGKTISSIPSFVE